MNNKITTRVPDPLPAKLPYKVKIRSIHIGTVQNGYTVSLFLYNNLTEDYVFAQTEDLLAFLNVRLTQ